MSIQQLKKDGVIKFLYNKGLISIDVLCYFDYYDLYQAKRDAGLNYTTAIQETADRFNVSISTVKRAIRMLK